MELAVLIGLQGSGKSSFYRSHFEPDWEHVSKDLMPRSARNKDRRQREQIARALGEGRSVVVDNTNVRRADRAALIEQAHARGARVVGYFFDAQVRECLVRNAQRTGPARVPDVALFATLKRLERPSPEEGFDALYRVTLRRDQGFDVAPITD